MARLPHKIYAAGALSWPHADSLECLPHQAAATSCQHTTNTFYGRGAKKLSFLIAQKEPYQHKGDLLPREEEQASAAQAGPHPLCQTQHCVPD